MSERKSARDSNSQSGVHGVTFWGDRCAASSKARTQLAAPVVREHKRKRKKLKRCQVASGLRLGLAGLACSEPRNYSERAKEPHGQNSSNVEKMLLHVLIALSA